MEWMLLPYKRYFDFSGRSRRKEYWMFVLLNIIVAVLASALIFSEVPMTEEAITAYEGQSPGTMFYVGVGILLIFGLFTFIPSLAVQIRRFHDQDKSGWFILLGLIPYIGGIIVLVFMCLEGTKGPNRFGPDPKDPASSEVFA
jgi:uncharacterized membrane protein YhaH (DUF805 family)